MKVLVAYMSKTGNTRKVAEAMFEVIGGDKEIKPIDQVDCLDGWDLAFLGFPIHGEGPDRKTTKFMERYCINGRNVVLFITHAAPENSPDLPPMLEKFRQAASGANLVDMFDCQGELDRTTKRIMSVLPSARLRGWAREDNSQGQPDAANLERARAFCQSVMKRLHENRITVVAPTAGKSVRMEYFHASKYGNGARVAEEFRKLMADRGVTVNVHHVRESKPEELPPADLYLFSSPGRFGKPIGDMTRFLKKVRLTPGTRYAVLTTEFAPGPDKKTGRPQDEEELGRCERMIPIMNQMLQAKGLVKIAEGKILVTGIKGPLEEGWQQKVEVFASQLSSPPASAAEVSPDQSLCVSVA